MQAVIVVSRWSDEFVCSQSARERAKRWVDFNMVSSASALLPQPFMAHDRDRITSGRFEVKNIVLPAGIIIAVYCRWNFKRIVRTLL